MYDYRQFIPLPYSQYELPSNRHGSGETRLEKYDRFQFYAAQLPNHPSFCMNRDGIVYDYRTGAEVPFDRDNNHVILDGERLDVDILLLYNFTGILPFDIVPRDKIPISKYHIGRRSSKLTYLVKSIVFCKTDLSIVYINDLKFKRCPYAPHIAVSVNGVVYDLKEKDFVMRTHRQGYASIYITIADMHQAEPYGVHVRSMRLSNLVFTTYTGPITPGYQVDHIDNCRYNDCATNLQLLTAVENTRKSREEGARDTGFSIETNRLIAKMLSERKTNAEIAAALGRDYKTRQDKHRIASLVNKLRTQPGYFEDLRKEFNLGEYDPNNSYPFNRLGADMYEQIRAEAASGMKGAALARKYNVTPATISRIINRKTKADLKAQNT